ncbi:pyridoxamine 5'-phosphate oxidase family protein [Larkinella terrae]|uniref:Pyridoxamine 5'-phosphate oxidase family protein n=1 Tax=Larkinella terrae TaxID=2025311 RepID=A0A7K0ELV5_9BACT|nr:pyridoxamine 5'-phosphate oxidase family protein [Larkinella terrae]MRS62830.1 pyridoxamine 5'-phosphate oxidase family protein [Larkinella terrae]
MQTPRTTPSRSAKRAHYDTERIYSILDEALFCTISYAIDGQPWSIPTAFARDGDQLLIHGSVGSHFIREIEKGIPVCISVTLLDGLVLAKSGFSHSVNYRSVIIFATARKVEDHDEKVTAFVLITNKLIPNRWDDLRKETASEVRKTTVLAFSLDEASAKIRTGGPNDEPEDRELPIWSGVIPLETVRHAAIPDESSVSLPLPDYLR